MPILGAVSSAISGNLDPSAYFPIATTTLATATATITFSSIPATYTHLQVRITSRSSRSASTADEIFMTINGNSLTKNHYLFGNGGAMYSGTGTAGWAGIQTAASATTGIYGGTTIDILDYASTTKNKTVRSLSGFDSNGGGEIYLLSNFINSTTAISSLAFSCSGANTFLQYTQFALYGITG